METRFCPPEPEYIIYRSNSPIATCQYQIPRKDVIVLPLFTLQLEPNWELLSNLMIVGYGPWGLEAVRNRPKFV